MLLISAIILNKYNVIVGSGQIVASQNKKNWYKGQR